MAWAEHEKKMKSSPIMRSEQPNRHILVVNDHKAIHDDFLEILQTQVEPDAMSLTRSNLFGESSNPSRLDPFQVDCVDQGAESRRTVSGHSNSDGL